MNIEILSSNFNSLNLTCESDGVSSSSTNRVIWRCIFKGCNVRCSTSGDKIGENYRAKTTFSDEPTRKIISEYVAESKCDEAIVNSPSDDADRQAINRAKRKAKTQYPPEPEDLKFIEIPDELKYTLNEKELFLLFDSGADDKDRFFIFGNDLYEYFDEVYVGKVTTLKSGRGRGVKYTTLKTDPSLNLLSKRTSSKKIQLEEITNKIKPEIISLNETFFNSNFDFSLDNYDIYRKDRSVLNANNKTKSGGGAALCVKKNFIGKPIYIESQNEVIGYRIDLNDNSSIAIFSIYASPSVQLDLDLLSTIKNNYPNFLKVGDLNARRHSWNCIPENKKGKNLFNFIKENNLKLLNSPKIPYPSGKSTLDLSICSQSVYNFFISHDVINEQISDHLPTITSLSLSSQPRFKTFKSTNWTKFDKILKNQSSKPSVLNEELLLESEATQIINEITQALEKSKFKFKINSQSSSFNKIPSYLIKLIKQKRKIRRLYQKTNSSTHKKLFNFLEKALRRELTKYKDQNLTENLKQLSDFKQNNSKHWKILREIGDEVTTASSNISIKVGDIMINEEQELAELFSENLSLIFADKNNRPFTERDQNETIQQEPELFSSITKTEFIDALSNLKNKASPGEDRINNKILKHLPLNYLNRIFNLFNASLRLGHVPSSWRSSTIIMIPKKDKPKTELSSFRPISLINCISKWLEKIINTKLKNWIEKENILPETQAGFRKNRNTQDQILRLNQAITQNF
ncbi:unnamed protein product, partial [Brachionus calyciflorus]